jgi:dienelactone hydrolase
MQRITFCGKGDAEIVGSLHLPEGPGPFPGVLVAGPMTSVKEQVTGVYAAALAARGFVALCIDHRFYGESDGTPRQYEYYVEKIHDLKTALDYLATRPEVDVNRLAAAGVCLGSGYISWSVYDDPRVKAIGLVTGYYRDVPAMRESDPNFDAKVQAGVEARLHYEKTGEVLTIPAAALEGDAAMQFAAAVDYYANPKRAGVPNYVNKFAIMSREHFLVFDVQSVAEKIKVPVVMCHSETSIAPPLAKKFFEQLQCPKAIHWMPVPNQMEFYDRPEHVNMAADHLASHFKLNL